MPLTPRAAAARAAAAALALAVIAALGFAEQRAGEPRLTVQPPVATVGDPVRVTLTLPGFPPGEIGWPPVGDRLGDLTVLGVDTARGRALKKAGGPQVSWMVAAYDTGSFSTGDLLVSTPAGTLSVPGGTLRIVSVLPDSGEAELKPLKAQEDLPITLLDLLRWWGPWLAGALLLAAAAWWAWKRLRRPAAGEAGSEPEVPPYEEARAALAALRADNPLARGDLKGYVSALVEIAKRLLERVHRAPVLEMTTWEVRRWASRNGLRCEPSHLLRLLEDADGVKFAKLVLEPARCEEMLRQVESIIEAYKPEPPPERENGAPETGEKGGAADTEAADTPAGGEAGADGPADGPDPARRTASDARAESREGGR